MRSRSPGTNLVCVLPRCTCVPGLVILGQIFVEILSGNRFRKMTCDIVNEVKVTGSELGLRPSKVHLCTRFGDPRSNICRAVTVFAKVTSVTLKMRSRSLGANLVCFLPMCTCVPGLVILGQIFVEILGGNRFRKSDFCDLENEVKVTRSELGLRPSKVHLCTRFGDPRSNICRDIERKRFCLCPPARSPTRPYNPIT
jgi:hypothetical protein